MGEQDSGARQPVTPHAVLLVASDAALADPSENRAAPIIASALQELGVDVTTHVVAADRDAVRTALHQALAVAELVVTCGGTGIRPGDVVVDETLALGPVELPGIAEEIRRRGAASTPASLVSRGVAGVVRHDDRLVAVVNAPSSRGGARDVAAVLTDVWKHLHRDLTGAPRD